MRAVPAHPSPQAAATGVGLGLRWEFLDDLVAVIDQTGHAKDVPFFEVAPENHMRRGGYIVEALEFVADHVPLISHGLALSLGGLDPYEPAFMRQLAAFLEHFEVPFHSDHLCFCGTDGRALHDLLPMPFTHAAARHLGERIREAQDTLGLAMAVENISYYGEIGAREMSEVEFLAEVLEQADCKLLLDVNNVYVNSLNFGFEPLAWLERIDMDRVVQLHVAGHEYRTSDQLTIDSHGAPVETPVGQLLQWTIAKTGPLPVVLERDNDVPSLDTLLEERQSLQTLYDAGLREFQERPE
jgi:uncharacterized protein (UPF0276 family)